MKTEDGYQVNLNCPVKGTSRKEWENSVNFKTSIYRIHDPGVCIKSVRIHEVESVLSNDMEERNPANRLKIGLSETPGSPFDDAANYLERRHYSNRPYNRNDYSLGETRTRNQVVADTPSPYAHSYSRTTTGESRTAVPQPSSIPPVGHQNRGYPSLGLSRTTDVYPRSSGYGRRSDWVDGDEPGTVIDPELENLTQPHMVVTQPRYPRFSDEEIRMQTFATWRNPFPSVVLLVLSGFFFLGGRDSVQCFHCGVILHSWEESDIPDEEHKKHSPNCVFMRLKARGAQARPPSHERTGHYRNHVSDSQHYEQPEPASRRTQQQQQEIMKTVAGLGHSMDDIEKAMERLKLSGKENIDASILVDAVFDIENNEDLRDIDVTGACGGEPAESGQRRTNQKEEAQFKSGPHREPQQTTETDLETKGILEKAKQLERENEDLRKQTTCRVCFEQPATEVFLPCGHLACCEDCSGRLSECPYCRKKILRTVHVFIP